tara:strand:- start:169 stop:1215 length:1047 start_codon:yes stop_codon:yes gene_type:complete
MNNTTLQIKFKQRLNKIASNDFDNIECWQIVEAFNKAQISWCRRQLHGTNQYREGDEASKRRIDDLQVLLTSRDLAGIDITYDDKYGYFRADNFNEIYDQNYLEFKRLEAKASQTIKQIQGENAVYETVTIYTYHTKRSTNVSTSDPAAWNAEVGASIPDYITNINDLIGTPQYEIQLQQYQWDENGYGPIQGSTEEQVLITEATESSTSSEMAPGASKEKCCTEPRTMTVYLSEVASTDVILRDPLKDPDFEWGETFCTLQDSEIRIWRKDFWIVDPKLIYYRKPTRVEIQGCVDPYTTIASTVDVESEFKDDIVELIIDEAVSIIAGDISDPNLFQRGDAMGEKNN